MSARDELRLNNHERMSLGAWRTGRRDARVIIACDPKMYGAREGSAWAVHYRLGFDGMPSPVEGFGE